jgi:transmembrane sensor
MSTDRTNEIDATASDWLASRDSPNWSEADQERFEEWLNASTANRVSYLRLELAWEEADRLKALGAGVRSDLPPPRGQWNFTPFFDLPPPSAPPTLESEQYGHEQSPVPPSSEKTHISEVGASRGETDRASRHRLRFFAIAATLLLVSGISAYVALVPVGVRYATAVGGIASIPMIDGSHITLNTDSQVRVALTDTERRVDLKHGEAFFEVSKDPQRPFVVRVGSKRITAVGTQFSVRRDSDDIQVIVTEGKVRVEDTAAPVLVTSMGLGGEISQQTAADVLLTPGNIARASDAGVLVQRKTLGEAQEHLSWRTGVLMFREQRLGDAIAEFNRYNERKIVLEDPALASLKIEGNFRANRAEAFVRLLESGFPISATVQEDRIILRSK